MRNASRPTRALASFLSLALIHAAFGPQVWAQTASRLPTTRGSGIASPYGSHIGSSSVGIRASSSLSLPAAGLAATVAPTPSRAPTASPNVVPFLAATPAAPAFAREAGSVRGGLRNDVAAAPQPAALPAKPLPAALRTDGVAAKFARIAAGVKRLFTHKPIEDLPAASEALVSGRLSAAHASDLKPSAGDPTLRPLSGNDIHEPPAPPRQPEGKEGKDWFGLGKSAVFFIGALVIAQIGVEALGSAMPALVQKTFGDFTVVAQLGIFSSIAGIVGRQLGPLAVSKWGLRNTYLAGTAARIVSISILSALLASGHMTLPLMLAFYSVNGLIGGVTLTAESSIPPALLGGSQAKIEKFWTWEQTLLEVIGVAGPIATGALVTSMGFLPALIAFPATFAVALAILFFTLRIPQKIEAMRRVDLQNAQDSLSAGRRIKSVFSQFFQRIAEGARLVWRDPLLRVSFIAYTVYMMLNPFLYSLLAPAFGIRLVGEERMAAVYGLLTGLYSFGGLLGGFLMIREQKRLGERKKNGMSDAEESEALRLSMLKWMKRGIAGLLAVATLALPLAPLGAFLALPGWLAWAGSLTLPAVALIPFGVAQVIATVKLRSYFQAKVPEGRMPEAMGFFGSASLLVSTIGLLALKYLFKGLAGFTPFWIIAAALIPLGIYYFFLQRQLAAIGAPPAPPTQS